LARAEAILPDTDGRWGNSSPRRHCPGDVLAHCLKASSSQVVGFADRQRGDWPLLSRLSAMSSTGKR
jgi:hypothetical protein